MNHRYGKIWDLHDYLRNIRTQHRDTVSAAKKRGYLIIVYCQTSFLIHYKQSREMLANKSCLYVFLIIRLPDFIAFSLIRGSSITSDICRGPYNEVCLDQFWQRYSRMELFSCNSILKIRFIQNMIIIPPVQNAKTLAAQSLLEGLLVGKKVKDIMHF